MVIFCNELNWRSFCMIIGIRLGNAQGKKASFDKKIFIFDSRSKKFLPRILEKFLSNLGFQISEKKFFTGTLLYDDNESVMSRALNISSQWSSPLGKDVLKNSRFLSGLAKKRGEELLLRLCTRPVMRRVTNTVSRILVADTLRKEEGCPRAYLIIENHSSLRDLAWTTIAPNLDIRFYNPHLLRTLKSEYCYYAPSKLEGLQQRWPGGLLLLFYFFKLISTSAVTKKFIPESKDSNVSGKKSLLLLQDDDIGLGGALRSHPFWMTRESPKPDYKIFILEDVFYARLNKDLDRALLASKNVFLIPVNFGFNVFSFFFCPTVKSLFKDFLKCVWVLFFGSPQERLVMFPLGQILCRAMVLSRLCEDFNIGAFMSCETYKVDCDAIYCVEKEMRLITLAYQYSNIRFHSPVMIPSAHILFSFSPLYHEVWGAQGARPERYVDIGYIYSSFRAFVEPRASQVREQLIEKGANFILTYFDENFGIGKYGFLHIDEHYEVLRLLLDQVNRDEAFGLIVKTQFMKNLPERLTDIISLRNRALASGRYVELYEGHHRNNILPMEAALASDMTIGHYVGATASLESATVGRRAVMVNSCRFKGMFGHVFERPHLLYTSWEKALEDIEKYRRGEKNYQDVGDWQPFIKQLEPFLDDKASQRIRKEIDIVMASVPLPQGHC